MKNKCEAKKLPERNKGFRTFRTVGTHTPLGFWSCENFSFIFLSPFLSLTKNTVNTNDPGDLPPKGYISRKKWKAYPLKKLKMMITTLVSLFSYTFLFILQKWYCLGPTKESVFLSARCALRTFAFRRVFLWHEVTCSMYLCTQKRIILCGLLIFIRTL